MRALLIAASFVLTAGILAADTPQDRFRESADVLTDAMQMPEKGIPQDLLAKAQCMIIIPNLIKGAFIVGGEYGKGFAVCREPNGRGWTAPDAVKMEGGSLGFQWGGQSTDLVLLVMSKSGMRNLLRDKWEVGASASVAAGPVGRQASASSDYKMNAEILSYSHSKGLFAGVSLKGATIRPDTDTNRELYGPHVTRRAILNGQVPPPAAARPLLAKLDHYSFRSGTAGRTR
jgi:SH3 domain-containing YSC84-like protein 1